MSYRSPGGPDTHDDQHQRRAGWEAVEPTFVSTLLKMIVQTETTGFGILQEITVNKKCFPMKNPADRKHQISRQMRILAPIFVSAAIDKGAF